jgi:hypothetical protein
MKNFARFLRFFSLCFPIIFIIVSGIVFLNDWVASAVRIPLENGVTIAYFIESARWILPFTLYNTIIFSIDYGYRRHVPPLLILIFTVLLANLFVFAVSKGLDSVSGIKTQMSEINRVTLGSPGLMLSRPGIVITLLDNPSNLTGSRVVSIDGQPLIYQKEPRGADGNIISLPPAPFRPSDSSFLDGIIDDFRISGLFIAARFDDGNVSFFSWAIALTMLLAALGFVFEATAWPLANCFLGLLLFRGVLAFEVFLNSSEITEHISGFARGLIPDMLIVPVIFTVIAALILIYRLLRFFARAGANAVKNGS